MEVLFAGVPVAAFGPAVDWYSRLFGRAADVVAHDREVMWRVTDGGWLYVVEQADRSGRSIVAIAVDDLEQSVAEVACRGIVIDGIEHVGEEARKARTRDPEGNEVALIEVRR